MTRRTTLIAVFAFAPLILGGAWLTITFTTSLALAQSSRPAATGIGGPFTLIDTNSKTVTDQTYRGKWMLIYFGYTNCPDACPLALHNISVALEKLGPKASVIQPLFITVDPNRDTPQAMADYLKNFDPRIAGLTGSPAQTDVVAKAYHVYVAPQKSDGNDYLIAHSAYIYLMDPQGNFVNIIDGSVPGNQMAAKLHQMMVQSRM